jgi:hypothetical protein
MSELSVQPVRIHASTMIRSRAASSRSARCHQQVHVNQSQRALPIISLRPFFNRRENLTSLDMKTHRSSLAMNTATVHVETTSIPMDTSRSSLSARLNYAVYHPTIPFQGRVPEQAMHSRYSTENVMPANRRVHTAMPMRNVDLSQQRPVHRSHLHLGQFLTYVRMQSLARVRRAQQQQQRDEKSADHAESKPIDNRHVSQSKSNFLLDGQLNELTRNLVSEQRQTLRTNHLSRHGTSIRPLSTRFIPFRTSDNLNLRASVLQTPRNSPTDDTSLVGIDT